MDKNKLFVGNLSWKTTTDQLKAHFEQAGEVTSTKIVTDVTTGRSKGFGFIEMKDAEAAKKAVEQLNDQPLDTRPLRVSYAEDRKERGDSRGDRGDRGDRGNRGHRGDGEDRGYRSNDSYGSRGNYRNNNHAAR